MTVAIPGRHLIVIISLLAIATAAHAEPLPPAGQIARINGIDLYYETHGSGEPLLLIHGGLGNSAYWSKQLPMFAERFKVIVLDSRGHGRSTFTAEPISYALMTRDVVGLLDHLGIAAAEVLGWSDGAIIGLELAIHHRARVKRVVAFGANFRPEGVRTDIGDNARFNAFIAQAAADYQKISPAPERWQEFLDNIGQMWATQPNYSDAAMRSTSTPVLVLGGLNEEAIYVEHIQATAALIPGAQLVLMPATGHFALWDEAAEFNRIVLDFLSEAHHRQSD